MRFDGPWHKTECFVICYIVVSRQLVWLDVRFQKTMSTAQVWDAFVKMIGSSATRTISVEVHHPEPDFLVPSLLCKHGLVNAVLDVAMTMACDNHIKLDEHWRMTMTSSRVSKPVT